VVDGGVVEQVEAVQFAEVATVVRFDRDPAPPAGTRGAGELHNRSPMILAIGWSRSAVTVVPMK
jgi:hypothetical protein